MWYCPVLMNHLRRLFIRRGNLMLFPLVREMLSFYSQRHSSMTPSLTFISSKYDGRNCNFLMDFIDDALTNSSCPIQKVVFTLFFCISYMHIRDLYNLITCTLFHPLAWKLFNLLFLMVLITYLFHHFLFKWNYSWKV